MEFNVDDYLAHYGKKGMKWGKRNARRKEAVTNLVERKKSKFERGRQHNEEVKSARSNVKKMQKDLMDLEDAYMTTGSKKDAEAFLSAENAYLNHPDWAKARKMTTGEKAATGVLIVAGTLAAGAILKGIGGKPASALSTHNFQKPKYPS